MSTNISGKKREALLSKIAEIKTFIEKNADEKNASQLLGYLGELSREVNGKKYGLVFEEHHEKIDELLEENAPVFIEDKKLFVDNGGELNFLLEGDNLASLKLLEKTHRGKIDVIYIDPPYNTGNKDFIYDDDFVDSTDQFRHSKWLSFMEKRLEIARNLLSEKGVIFISIDDNEQASLKMLCDEIFGEESFVANMSWQRTYSTRNDSKGIPKEVEHILVYGKTIRWMPNKLPRTEKMNSSYKSPDNDPKPWTSSSVSAPGAVTHQGMVYAIQHPFSGEMMYPTVGRCWALGQEQMLKNMNKWCPYEMKNLNDEAERAKVCGIPKEKVKKDVFGIVLKKSIEQSKKLAQEILDRGNWPYFYFTNGGKGGIRRKTYLEDTDGKMPTNFLSYEECGHTDEAKKEIISLFGGSAPFDTPKPTRLLERILQLSTFNSPFSTVLDFFAGSGTTGHAVLKLNAEDGGHRKFILCTNNENNICRDITYQRLKTAITGKRKDKSKYSDGLPGSLKYFKTDFIPISEKMYYEYADELLLHVRELVELENAVNFDKDTSVAIVLDDDEMEEFIDKICHSESATNVASEFHESQTLNQVQGDRAKTLYLGHDVLLSSKQERILKAHNIGVNVIPDYYYRELAL